MAWDTNAFDWTGTIDHIAEQKRLAAQQPTIDQNNLLRNRLMAMEVDEKGQSLSAQKAKENYLMGYDPNKPVSELAKPKNVGEFQAYQEIQGSKAAQLKPLYDMAWGLVQEGYKDNRQDKLDQAKEIVSKNPELAAEVKKNGLWATIYDTKIDAGGGLHESPMYLDAEAIKKTPQLSPGDLPGYYNVKFTSPPGVMPFGEGAKIISAAPAKMTKDDLARRVANGDEHAAKELDAVVQGEAKDTGNPWIKGRTRQLMANGKMTHDAAEMQASEEYEKRQDKRSNQKVQFGVTVRGEQKEKERKLKDIVGSGTVDKPLPGGNEILAQKIANGTMLPSQLPKRQATYTQILGRAAFINPDLNIKDADINGKLLGSATFRQKVIGAEAMPEILTSITNAGKKVGYSHYRVAGAFQKWTKGELNNPDQVEYMTLRNDGLLSIANVMRGTGATDMAAKMESEAASPTMDPPALDAWLRAQMKSLSPRLRAYRKIEGNAEPAKSGSGKPSLSDIFK